MRKLKRFITYDGFLGVLENYPELLQGRKKTLEAIRDIMAKEFEKPPTEEDENWGLIHGDFWSGKYVMSLISLITLHWSLQHFKYQYSAPDYWVARAATVRRNK
jgi:hypothetical protein